MTAAPRPASTQAVLDRYDALRALVDRALTAPAGDTAATARAAPVLEAEARLVDARAYGAWLDLYADDACLWIPLHPDDHPARDQALAFDDRRRMQERAWHMHDRQAWAVTQPRPLTVRHLGPVAAWPDADGWLATCTLHLTHVRRGPPVKLSGRQVMALRDTPTGPRITAKVLLLPQLTLGTAQLGWIM